MAKGGCCACCCPPDADSEELLSSTDKRSSEGERADVRRGCTDCFCLLLFAHAAFQPLPVLLGDAISELLGTEPDAEVEVEVEGDNSTA